MKIFTINYTSGVMSGVIASLIAGLVMWIVGKIVITFQERSDFSGKWLCCIYDQNNIIKKDIIQIKHNKKSGWIHGKSKRAYPEKDNFKNWKVIGLLVGKDIICLIWSTQSFVSLNCSYLTQIENEGYKYRGYCLKNDKKNIKKYRISLSKI